MCILENIIICIILSTECSAGHIIKKVFKIDRLPPGASTLVIPPDAVFPCDLEDMDGLHRRDTTLDELHQNILRFIYAYAPGADTYITEE